MTTTDRRTKPTKALARCRSNIARLIDLSAKLAVMRADVEVELAANRRLLVVLEEDRWEGGKVQPRRGAVNCVNRPVPQTRRMKPIPMEELGCEA